MNKSLKLLRIIETIFLVGIIAEIWLPDRQFDLFFLSIKFNFWFGIGGTRFLISSRLLGYLLSIIATTRQWKSTDSSIKYFSIIIASLGVLSYVNMIARVFVYHPVSFLFDFAMILIILDWILVKKCSRASKNEAEVNQNA